MVEGQKSTAEAVVVGGGVMGCSILYNLGAMGMTDAVLVEQAALGSGSTSRSQAILRMHYSNEVTTQLAWESLKVFRDFDEVVGGPSGYVKTGYLLIASGDDRKAMERNVEVQQEAGVATEVIAAEDAPSAFRIADDEVCAFESDSGYADPHSVTQGYAAAASKLGAEVRTQEPVHGITVKRGRVTGVTTSTAEISTPIAVVTAGPWSGPLLSQIGVEAPLETVRHQVVTLRRPEVGVPDHAIVGDIPNSLSVRPDVGYLTLIGVGEEEKVGPDELNHGVDMDVVEDVAAKLTDRMPGMEHAVFRGGWSGLFTTTPDWHPILAGVPGIEGLYCAVGFSGHGFKLAPMVGVVMAELITRGNATSIDISMLGLDRFAEGRLMESRYGMAVLA